MHPTSQYYNNTCLFKKLFVALMLGIMLKGHAQTTNLVDDFRQHNLIFLNSSLFNPTFTLDRNNPNSATLWSRWQSQTPDLDPTTALFNYSHRFNESIGGGLSFFQNNSTIFQNTGGILNFAYRIPLSDESNLFLGTNVLIFHQDYDQNMADFANTEDGIIGSLSPGLRFQYTNFNAALAFENALSANFGDGEEMEDNMIVNGSMSYDIDMGKAVLRPQAYFRSIPNEDFQYGLAALYNHSAFWVQAGYNNVYNISGGVGLHFYKKLSIGALIEFSENNPVLERNESFELLVSYHFDRRTKKDKEEEVDDEVVEEDNKTSEADAEKDRLIAEQQRELDSLRTLQLARELERKRLDSIAQVQKEQEEKDILEREKIETVNDGQNITPGYYLVANVYGTEKYFQNFMNSLRAKGLEPKSFLRKLNGYQYVYLYRYDNLAEALRARDNSFNNRYNGKLWVLKVENE